MPTVADVFEKLANDRCCTTIDFPKGYWQIPVADADKHKTAFVTHDGTFELVKMSFGMINSSVTFRAMPKLLHGIIMLIMLKLILTMRLFKRVNGMSI